MMPPKGLSRLNAIALANQKNSSRKNKQLYTLLLQPDLYVLAYENIKSNKGALTPGTGEETLQRFNIERINKIIEQMRTCTWKPKSARRIYIPKPGKVTLRPLGIQGPDDKIVQETIRLILDAIYDPSFSKRSYGFRPNIGCHDALDFIQKNFDGINLVLEGDISAYFDTIHHEKLLELLRLRIEDERFLQIIQKMLRVGYWTKEEGYTKSLIGSPQGSILSPILSNVYLHELDKWCENWINAKITSKQPEKELLIKTPEQKLLNVKQGLSERNFKKYILQKTGDKTATIESLDKKDPQGREFKKEYRKIKLEKLKTPFYMESSRRQRGLYVRYADDFIVGFGRLTLEQVTEFKTELTVFLRDTLHLTLSQEKSKITLLTKEPALFLGYNVSIDDSRRIKMIHTRGKKPFLKTTTGWFVNLTVPMDRMINRFFLKGYCTKEGYPIAYKRLTPYSDSDIVRHFASVHSGVKNYYSGTRKNKSANSFSRIYYILKFSCAKTLASKHKSSINKIFTKHGPTLKIQEEKIMTTLRKGKITSKPIITTTEFADIKHTKAHPFFSKGTSFPNPLEKYLGKYTRSRLSDQCLICGATQNIEMHHLNSLKGIEPNTFAKLQGFLNRKQIPLCATHHREVTYGKYNGPPLIELLNTYLKQIEHFRNK